jgi:predicted nucleic acid-binding protein
LPWNYEAVTHRPEHLSASGLTHEEVEVFLGAPLSVGREISLGKFQRPNLTDPGDEHILNLALRGAADGLVTQNLRHFSNLQQKFGVKLYSPQEAVRLLRK